MYTGSLGFSDIHNQADFKTEHQGAGISSGGSIGKQFAGNMANALLAGGGNSGHAEGTTQAAVSEGTLIIRDKENQKQDVADLSRDAEHANGSISPIFDKEKEQQRLQEVQLIGEIGSQVVDIANTQGEINGLNAGRKELADKGITEPGADASDEVKAAYQNALRETGAYKTTTAKYGTGSDLQRGIQAATAALQGLAGSDLKAALAGASAPELAYRIGHDMGIDNNTAAKTIAHAILGGAVAALQGNSAAAGAAGAATGELAAKAIAGMLYPDVKDLSKLSEEQKQTVSALATISAGMAGGLAGDSTGSAVAGGLAGKNAAENNLLGGSEDAQAAWIRQHGIDMATCADNPSGAACQKAMNERDAVGVALATSTVALLPGSAQAMWGLGASANAGISYLADGTIDPANAAIAGWVNVISMGNGLAGTVGWNAAGGAFGNWLDGKDPLSGAAMNGGTSAIGYGVGKVIQGPLEKVINPNWKNWEWLDVGMGISKPLPLNPTPGIAGNIGSSIGSEGSGTIIQDQLKNLQEKK